MDVLSGSIDVRELLPGDALDESSPLSVPDLRLLIDRLQIRSLSIKDKVRSYVLAHRDDFYDLFSRCSSASSSVEGLSRSLSDALGLLSDRPLDLEIEALVSEIRDKRRELVERREALEVVRTLSAIHSQLTLAREDLKGGRLVAAAEAIRNLKKGMIFGSEKDEGGGVDEPAVFGFLRKDWFECFDELQDVLAKHVLSCVQYEPESSKLIVRSLSQIGDTHNIELRTVLEAMEIVKVLDYGLAKVADLVMKHVIVPSITNNALKILVEEHDNGSFEGCQTILYIDSSSELKEDKDGSCLYSRLCQIVNFVYRFICFQNADWMQCFGKLTWPRMSDLIIIHFLSKAVPDDASKIIGFQNIVKCSAEFETFLMEMKLIQSTDSNEEKLSQFAHDVEVHFASRKRNEILARSRSLLLQFNYDLFAVSDVGPNSSAYITDLLFQSDKCIVSKAVLDLMELVHGALKDACLSPARVAKEFYHAARDALLLYKAVIPIKLGKQLDSISQVAIVIYNECQYLSEEVLGLAYEYRTDFPTGLQKQALFLDIALNFRQMAENILQKQVHLVSVSLREAMDGADGFQNTHQPQHYESVKFSIEQKARIMWERLLLASTYKRTMCKILDSVFSEIARDMLLLDDLAAEETLQLQRLIQIIIENLSSLLESLIIDSVEKQNFLNETTWTHLDEKIPSLPKFRKLADLYDMPLKSITLTWESGELLSCGFTSSEIENFVKAIFADSPLRKECLQRIRSASD
ncbi:centromere/kinetochore protein zw10 homolog isoform X2 [Curcuma longa]|uniref:centromere/kinetochore protein zw10 homolog isoform X2 n=1 Tax=Curcuma longa TaxID=136217 RepID=UPI003D9E8BF2